jgi:iron complex transport system substrate-binding protein
MTDRRSRWAATLVAIAVWTIVATTRAAQTPQRIVSLIPSVTEMIFAIGAGGRVVGVSNYDRFPPEVSAITRVGGLLDPNVERILALRPDLVVLYNTQIELKQRLDRVRVAYYSYEHRGLADIAVTMRAIGARIGLAERSDRVAQQIERTIAEIRTTRARGPHPRTMLVFGREPSSLRNIEASGGYGFLHDMLETAGGVNVFADIKRQSVQASTEMILAAAPEVIIELRYGDSTESESASRALEVWKALPSLPAVKNHRVYALVGGEFVVPGPRVVTAIERLVTVLQSEKK